VSALGAASPDLRHRCRPLLVGNAWVLTHFCRLPSLKINPIADLSDYRDAPGVVNVLHVPHPAISSLVPGRPQKIAGESAVLSLRTAAALALRGQVCGVVTGPVSKESFKAAGVPFPGHTELLAALCGAPRVEMLLAAGPLKTLLLTRHIPLKDVPGRITTETIVSAVSFTDGRWRKMSAGRRLRWGVCGLNPHAGDNGLLGAEEKRAVVPAVKRLRRRGLPVEGPFSADAVWAKHAAGAFDIVLSLYHDQGMIPLKTLYPNAVVNITVGLPWVRTSPGHGTAFDLARRSPPFKNADPSATLAAARWALALSQKHPPLF